MISISRVGLGVLITIVSIVALPSIVTIFSSGPLDGKTGSPGEWLCTQCHGAAEGDGSVTIFGAPTNYKLNTNYTITIRVEDMGQQSLISVVKRMVTSRGILRESST